MSDLERVKRHLWIDDVDCVEIIDAHLKEDAERERQRVAYRNQAVDDYAALRAELTELREAVRAVWDHNVTKESLDRLRKLIEGEKGPS